MDEATSADTTGDASTDDRAGSRRRSRREVLAAAAATGALAAGAGGVTAAGAGDASFTQRSVTEGAESGVSAEYADGTVSVEGTMTVGAPCWIADVADVEIDGGAVRFTVEAGADPAAVCPQVVSSLSYVAEVAVDERPESVVVTHDGGSERTHTVSLADGTPTEETPTEETPTEEPTPTETSDAPVVETGEPVTVIDEAARVGGTVESDDGADSVTVGAEYRPAGGDEWSEATTDVVTESGSYAVELTDLSTGTEYEYRAVARAGPDLVARGETATFTTDLDYAGPAAGRPVVTNVDERSASFWMSVNPSDRLTTPLDVYVRYKPVDAEEWQRTEPVSASMHVDYSPDATDLQPGTTYEVQTVARDAFGNVTRASGGRFTTDPDLSPVGENDAAPTDPDDDGLYEDVNGNEDRDMADAVDLYQYREAEAVTNHTAAYDFSGNDEIDLADVVQLFQENT